MVYISKILTIKTIRGLLDLSTGGLGTKTGPIRVPRPGYQVFFSNFAHLSFRAVSSLT